MAIPAIGAAQSPFVNPTGQEKSVIISAAQEAEEGSGSPPPVHLHFLNAPITEIRRAVREIARADGGQDVAEPASGEMCHVA